MTSAAARRSRSAAHGLRADGADATGQTTCDGFVRVWYTGHHPGEHTRPHDPERLRTMQPHGHDSGIATALEQPGGACA